MKEKIFACLLSHLLMLYVTSTAQNFVTDKNEAGSFPIDTCSFKLNAYFSPTLNFPGDSSGLQFAVSVDDEQPQIISLNKIDHDVKTWSDWVANDVIIKQQIFPFIKMEVILLNIG